MSASSLGGAGDRTSNLSVTRQLLYLSQPQGVLWSDGLFTILSFSRDGIIGWLFSERPVDPSAPQESGDDEYHGEHSDTEDEVDSDFDIDEGDEPDSDQEDAAPRKKMRVVTKAYKVRTSMENLLGFRICRGVVVNLPASFWII
jgi:hypothetical protein